MGNGNDQNKLVEETIDDGIRKAFDIRPPVAIIETWPPLRIALDLFYRLLNRCIQSLGSRWILRRIPIERFCIVKIRPRREADVKHASTCGGHSP